LFDWDEANISHIALHGVTPNEAEEVLANDPTDGDEQFEDGEQRYLQIGITNSFRCLVVITTWRGERLRVVSAYPGTSLDRKIYQQRMRRT
jgi:uncharacterized protein